MRDVEGMTFSQIGALLGMHEEAARSRWRRAEKSGKIPTPDCVATGIKPGDTLPDEDEVYRRACEEWNKTRRWIEKGQSQELEFSHGPVALAFVADAHCGASGVDYPRLFAEAELIRETPGMYAGTVGDLVDSFIVSARFVRLRIGMRLSVPDEWALARRYLRVLGPKLKISVTGNHDDWMLALSGINYFDDVLREVAPECLHAVAEARLTVKVGSVSWPGRIRHKWRGSSIYNETHGIERAAKWDQDFEWAVGAHTHRGGVCRSFTHAGQGALGIMCGTYKRVDDFAIQGGFPKSGNSTAVAIVFDDETESMTGFSSLEACAKYMGALYGA